MEGVKEVISLCSHLGDGSRFVISANQLNSVWVSEFETRKERDRLDTEQSSVDIIAFTNARRVQSAAVNRQIVRMGRDLPKNR